MRSAGSSPPGRVELGSLLAAVALGTWLRVTGLDFGLPAVYNPDEIAILSRALAFGTGDLNPHNFLYPTFYFYALFAWLGAYFVAGWLGGWIPSLAAFQTDFFVNPSAIYLAGRTLTVMCGLATIVAVWWLARSLFGRHVALASALLMAVVPAAVRDAHYIKHDVPVTLLIVLATIAIQKLSEGAPSPFASTSGGRALIAGALCGAAFSTHYYAAFLAVPLALALAPRIDSLKLSAVRLAALSALGFLAAFLALSPFILAEPVTAWRDITANRRIVVDRSGVSTAVPFPGLWTYLQMLGGEAAGWPVVAASAWGAWTMWRLSRTRAASWLAFPIAFFLFISTTVPASRYLNPLLPFIVVLAAVGTSDMAVRLLARRRSLAFWLATLAVAAPAFLSSRAIGTFFSQTDTRTLAQRFIEASVPPGRTILLQPYSVQLTQSRDGLVEALTARVGGVARASTKFALRLRLDPWPSPSYRTLFLGTGGLDADKIYTEYAAFEGDLGAETLRRLDVDYVVLKRLPDDAPATAPLRATLEAQGRLLVRFSPYRQPVSASEAVVPMPYEHNTDTPLDAALERPGPIMEVWAVR